MPFFKKNKIILISIIFVVLITASIFIWSLQEKTRPPKLEKEKPQVAKEDELTEEKKELGQTWSIAGWVVSIDPKINYLVADLPGCQEGNEVCQGKTEVMTEVFLDEKTEIIKHEPLPDSDSKAGSATYKTIGISDIKKHDLIIIHTKEDPGGKNNIDNVLLIEVVTAIVT